MLKKFSALGWYNSAFLFMYIHTPYYELYILRRPFNADNRSSQVVGNVFVMFAIERHMNPGHFSLEGPLYNVL